MVPRAAALLTLTVLTLGKDAWLVVKLQTQATNDPPLPPFAPSLQSRSALM